MARQSRPPEIRITSRTTLVSKPIESAIDGVLKDLKSCTRALSKTFLAFADETRVLERLYYKGKNQHRYAVFWRHTAEMRKYSRRLEQLEISCLVDSFQQSFFGEEAKINPKLLKGSWTHFPNDQFMLFVADQLADTCVLASKAHERFQEIYRSYMAAMQSGYFLQLVVTLISIVARMDALILQAIDSCTVAAELVRRAVEVLNMGCQPTATGQLHEQFQLSAVAANSPGDVLSQSTTSSSIARPVPSPAVVPQSQPVPRANPGKRKKKNKMDEIDAIFGF